MSQAVRQIEIFVTKIIPVNTITKNKTKTKNPVTQYRSET